jgi:RNA polymerase primary sigma factor
MARASRIERQYYKDIGRFPILEEGEERSLIMRIQKGEKLAINNLILGNLRFVVSIARKYQNRGLSLLELINEGNIGLYKAAKRFNTNKEVKFTSYAVWWVRQSIQKALFDQTGIVKIPPNKLALINKFKKALEKNNGDFYKTLEQSDFKNAEFDVVEVLEKITPISLDAPISDERDAENISTLLDIIGIDPDQEDEMERIELKKIIDNILANMTQREETILRMYYGIDYDKEFTLEEIGNKLKLTRERVRQIKNKSLRKLFRNEELRSRIKLPDSKDQNKKSHG